MISTLPAFKHLDINATSPTRAIRDITLLIEKGDPIQRALELIKQLTDVEIKTTELDHVLGTAEVWALTFAQAAVEYCIINKHEIDPQEARQAIINRAVTYINKKSNKWMFATEQQADVVQRVKVDGDITVPVTAEGKIKRGGKEHATREMYQTFLAEKKARGEGPLPTDNRVFVGLLMTKLNMTLAGARTYSHNVRKHFSGQK